MRRSSRGIAELCFVEAAASVEKKIVAD